MDFQDDILCDYTPNELFGAIYTWGGMEEREMLQSFCSLQFELSCRCCDTLYSFRIEKDHDTQSLHLSIVVLNIHILKFKEHNEHINMGSFHTVRYTDGGWMQVPTYPHTRMHNLVARARS